MNPKRSALSIAVMMVCGAAFGVTLPQGTTLEKTIARSTDWGRSASYKYLVEGPGEGYFVKHLFPIEPSVFYTDGEASITNPLIAFAQLSDFQIVDDRSPLRVTPADRLAPGWDTGSAYRPQEQLSTHMADALIRKVRFVGVGPASGVPLKLALITGDNVDNMQRNETRWYINLLDGAEVRQTLNEPQSVGRDSAVGYNNVNYFVPGLYSGGIYAGFPTYGVSRTSGSYWDAVRAPFQATGIGMPWYTALGNHDRMVQGNLPLNPSDYGLNWSRLFSDGVEGFLRNYALGGITPELITGVPEHQPSNARLIEGFAVGDFHLYNRAVSSDSSRALVNRPEYIDEHFRTTGSPVGHGYTRGATKGYYSFLSGPDSLFKFIALDTNESNEFGAQGAITPQQFAWLEEELKAVSSRYRDPSNPGFFVEQPGVKDRLIVVYAHHMIEDISKGSSESVSGSGDQENMVGSRLEQLLLRFPNVIMYVNGHSHANATKPHRFPGGTNNKNGFWEINTSSSFDWPMQARTIEVAVGVDPNVLSIFTTMLDMDAPLNPGEDMDSIGVGSPLLKYQLASLGRQLGANDPQQVADLDKRRGLDPASRNAHLTLPMPFPIHGGGKPHAVASYTKDTADPLTVHYSAEGSFDPDGTIASWEWTFSDGTRSNEQNPTKTFAQFGQYTATLKVTDNLKFVDTATTAAVALHDPCVCDSLQNGVPVHAYRQAGTSRGGATFETPARYSYYVAPGTTSVTFSSANDLFIPKLNDNTDLYVDYRSVPTLRSFRCSSTTPRSNEESCTIDHPEPGYWYVQILPNGDQLQSLKANVTATSY